MTLLCDAGVILLDASHSQGLKGEGRDFCLSKYKYINKIYP